MIVVVDASVVVRWVVAEPFSAEAVAVLSSGARLIAPELLRLEISNALIRKYRMGALSEAQARETLTTLLTHVGAGLVELSADAELLPRATRLAFELRHPLFDCLYLALAEREAGVYLTADAVFVEKLAKSPWRGSVVALGSQVAGKS